MFQRESGRQSESVYYPNSMGLHDPGSKSTYGLLIEAKDDKGSICSNVSYGLLKSGARILSMNGYANKESKLFTLQMICDFKDSNTSVDDLIISIRKLKQVTYSDARCLKGLFFDEQLFPLVMTDTNRVVVMNSNFGFQTKINQIEKSAVLKLGRDYGKRVVDNMRKKFADYSQNPIPRELLESNIKAYLIASGWGKFFWESSESYERVVVQDPPVSEEGTAAGNPFLRGIVSGILEELRGKSFGIMEDHYDPVVRRLTLTLVEMQIADWVPSVVQTKDELPKSEKDVEEIVEVEKVIRSIESSNESEEVSFNQEFENEIESS